MFTDRDLLQFKQKSVGVEKINYQLSCFTLGFPFINLFRPATPGNGIRILSPGDVYSLENEFEKSAHTKQLVKFVPASGAATRMFKHLFEYLESDDKQEHGRQQSEKDRKLVNECIDQIKNFAFYPELLNIITTKWNLKADESLSPRTYIEGIVGKNGLNYGQLPKGLLIFHSYQDGPRTSAEEHIAESIGYCVGEKRQIFLHFTVSPEHLSLFEKETASVIKKYEDMYRVKILISFSIQKPSTDTIAVDLHNHPFREKDGKVHFRPGGHGALIENLGEIKGDIIFIKNIDNIVPDSLKEPTIQYKKVLAGLLLQVQAKLSEFMKRLDSGIVDDDFFNQIIQYYTSDINPYFEVPEDISAKEEKIQFFHNLLNRPLRICGMVKNEGEPGGGPFWVKEKDGSVTLQIVESSQIDMKDETQKQILGSSTHFNPVDLVCGTKDYKGNFFDLNKFINPDTGFISIKSKDGRDLKALELPGLWNGAMAGWISLFVEVPLITFNPVKTINDLLRKEHQGNI